MQDTLSSAHTFVSAGSGGSYDAVTRTVSWSLGTLVPGETRTVTLATKVGAGAVDGQNLSNSFTLTSTQTPQPLTSNTVVNPVWSAQLIITKAVDSERATYGDRLTYTLTIRNSSPTTPLTSAVITDTLPLGLVYLPGSSTLAGTPIPDPEVDGRVLTWRGQTLPAGGQISVTYAVRVTPDANGSLVNTVVVAAQGNNATAIASNVAVATVKAVPLTFAPAGRHRGLRVPGPQPRRHLRPEQRRAYQRHPAGPRPRHPGRGPGGPDRPRGALPLPERALRHPGAAAGPGLGPVCPGTPDVRGRADGHPDGHGARPDQRGLPAGPRSPATCRCCGAPPC